MTLNPTPTPTRYHEVEPLHFTEIHFKPAPVSSKRPSSYDVPIHAASSYYRQPVSSYSKPHGPAPYSPGSSPAFGPGYGPGYGLGHGPGYGPGHDASQGDSYEVVDDYRPLGAGPAFGEHCRPSAAASFDSVLPRSLRSNSSVKPQILGGDTQPKTREQKKSFVRSILVI